MTTGNALLEHDFTDLLDRIEAAVPGFREATAPVALAAYTSLYGNVRDIVALRVIGQMNQKAFAEALGIAQSEAALLECGELQPSPALCVRLCEVLHISQMELDAALQSTQAVRR